MTRNTFVRGCSVTVPMLMAAASAVPANAASVFDASFTRTFTLVDVEIFGPGSVSDLDVFVGLLSFDTLIGQVGNSGASGGNLVVPGVGSLTTTTSNDASFLSNTSAVFSDVVEPFRVSAALQVEADAITARASLNGQIFTEADLQALNSNQEAAFRLTFERETVGHGHLFGR